MIFLENYLTLKEMATLWGISTRRVQILCKENRVEGAIFMGNMWFIPKSTMKPSDARIKSGRYMKTNNEND